MTTPTTPPAEPAREAFYLLALQLLEQSARELLAHIPEADFVCWQVGWKAPLDHSSHLLTGLAVGSDGPPVLPQQLLHALDIVNGFQQRLLQQFGASLRVLQDEANRYGRDIHQARREAADAATTHDDAPAA